MKKLKKIRSRNRSAYRKLKIPENLVGPDCRKFIENSLKNLKLEANLPIHRKSERLKVLIYELTLNHITQEKLGGLSRVGKRISNVAFGDNPQEPENPFRCAFGPFATKVSGALGKAHVIDGRLSSITPICMA